MVPVIGSFATSGKYAMKASDIMAKMGTKFTKSSIDYGKLAHKGYKITDEDKIKLFKEYKINGGRVDFINFNTNTIYELKPYNPNGVRKGIRQLRRYKTSMERSYPGSYWNTIIEFY